MIRTTKKGREWMWEKDRIYCPQCGHRVSTERSENRVPICEYCEAAGKVQNG